MTVSCASAVWQRLDPVLLSDGASVLGLSGVEYSQRNCPNCVINGDSEVTHSKRIVTKWVVEDAILMHAEDASETGVRRDEL